MRVLATFAVIAAAFTYVAKNARVVQLPVGTVLQFDSLLPAALAFPLALIHIVYLRWVCRDNVFQRPIAETKWIHLVLPLILCGTYISCFFEVAALQRSAPFTTLGMTIVYALWVRLDWMEHQELGPEGAADKRVWQWWIIIDAILLVFLMVGLTSYVLNETLGLTASNLLEAKDPWFKSSWKDWAITSSLLIRGVIKLTRREVATDGVMKFSALFVKARVVTGTSSRRGLKAAVQVAMKGKTGPRVLVVDGVSKAIVSSHLRAIGVDPDTAAVHVYQPDTRWASIAVGTSPRWLLERNAKDLPKLAQEADVIIAPFVPFASLESIEFAIALANCRVGTIVVAAGPAPSSDLQVAAHISSQRRLIPSAAGDWCRGTLPRLATDFHLRPAIIRDRWARGLAKPGVPVDAHVRCHVPVTSATAEPYCDLFEGLFGHACRIDVERWMSTLLHESATLPARGRLRCDEALCVLVKCDPRNGQEQIEASMGYSSGNEHGPG